MAARLLPEAVLRAAKPTDFVVRIGGDGREKLVTNFEFQSYLTVATTAPLVIFAYDYYVESRAAKLRGEEYKYFTPKNVLLHFAVGMNS